MPTRWTPLDCTCLLEFTNGPSQPPVHVKRCPEHQQATGQDVWHENQAATQIRNQIPEADQGNIQLQFERTESGPRLIRVKGADAQTTATLRAAVTVPHRVEFE
jgi:hypothetical protein